MNLTHIDPRRICSKIRTTTYDSAREDVGSTRMKEAILSLETVLPVKREIISPNVIESSMAIEKTDKFEPILLKGNDNV